MTDDQVTFRVVPQSETQWADYGHKDRSKAQQRRDEILTESEALLRQARELVDEALENLGLLVTPQHRNLSTLIGQQIEQVIEFRRVAG